jgi:hypothetical protein
VGGCVCPKGTVVKDGKCETATKEGTKPSNPKPSTSSKPEKPSGPASPSKPVAQTPDGGAPSQAPSADSGDSNAAGNGERDAEAMLPAAEAGPTSEPVATCGSSAECAEDELCDVYGTEQCEPGPDGRGQHCDTADDCAGTEATYCEAFSTHTCQVQGCKENGGVCPGDMSCCDFAVLSTSLCVGADSLEMGQCPAPGMLIEREEQ